MRALTLTTPLPPTPPLPELEDLLRGANPLVRGLMEPLLAPLFEAIALLQAQNRELQLQVAALQDENADLREQLAVKKDRIDQLERQLYGRKSERMKVSDPKRAAAQERRKARSAEERKAARDRARERRVEALSKLKSVTVVLPLPEDACCPSCGGADLRKLPGGETSTQYEWHPGHLEKCEYVREKAACTCGHGIVTAPPPPQVIEGGQYGPGLHAYVVVSKCMDAMPLHRLSKSLERQGVPMSEAQLGVMFHRVAELSEPIYLALLARLPESQYVRADETRQPVQEPGKVRQGWMWTFLDEMVIAYVYDPSRGGKVPARVLGLSKGKLTVDGHTGYNKVTTPEGRQRTGCWSHGRRGLYEAYDYDPVLVDKLLLDIHDLFVVEQQAISEEIVGTQRHLRLRRRQSAPIVERIFATLVDNVDRFSPSSSLAKAMRYILNQRKELSVFLTDAKVPVDNNASESALRIVALLRKNALFVGNDAAGHNLAILLTLCATCRLHEVNPERWFADVLLRISERGSTVEELLPWVWKTGRGLMQSVAD